MEYSRPPYSMGNMFPSMQSRVPSFPDNSFGLSGQPNYPYRGLGNYPYASTTGQNPYAQSPYTQSTTPMGVGGIGGSVMPNPMSTPVDIGAQPATQQGSPYTLGVPPSQPLTSISDSPPTQMPNVSQSGLTSGGPEEPSASYAKGGLVDAAHKLQNAGRYGDSELIHVNPVEREAMRDMFGPETRNPQTGLPEHFFQFIPALLMGAKALLATKIGSAAATAAASSLASKVLGPKGSSSSQSSAAPATPGILTAKDTLKYNSAPREQTAYDFDPRTYGQKGGQHKFFKPYDPMAYTLKAPEKTVSADPAYEYKDGGEAEDFDKNDQTDHLVAYAKGGGHQGPGHVRGIGSGQEDKIPAWLSDGEYVWSAQDVADLGDGSTNEGVRRLDKMRKMVRAQAGRKNVKSIAKPQKGIDHMLKAVGEQI